MQKTRFTLIHQEELAPKTYRMVLDGDTSAVTAPGQFVNIALEGRFLRRPISVCDWNETSVTLLYKVVGGGTDWLSKCESGDQIDALCGLGNGFDGNACGNVTLVIGGGIGIPPMYGLAKRLLAAGKTPIAVLGFNTEAERFYEAEFQALGVETIVATADGSYGVRGFVTDALPERFDTLCACGPLPMLKALCARTDKPGQLSLEARMGCGFGACMGCSCKTKYGAVRICRDGPVLEREAIVW